MPYSECIFLIILLGHITGGSLKTLDQADKESMQANWWPADIDKLQKEIPLRNSDMLSLINAGRQWYENKPFHSMPVDIPHVSSSLRLVLVNCGESGKKKKEMGGEVSVLMNSGAGSSTSLPVAVGGSQFGETLKVIVTKISCYVLMIRNYTVDLEIFVLRNFCMTNFCDETFL